MRKNKFAKARNTAILLVIVLCILTGVSILLSRYTLSVTRYEYHSNKLTQPLRIVQLTDLHDSTFGDRNERLIEKIRQQEPDIVAMTGDMLNSDSDSTELENLISRLSADVPVFYSLGNHEIAHQTELVTALKNAGAIVLEQEYMEVEISGQQLRIGGLYGYALSKELRNTSEQDFLEDFEDSNSIKILLAHISEGLLLYTSIQNWDIDLVLSGHAHGGLVRIPIIGGLYTPEEKWFPTYTKGCFDFGNKTIILSSGLGTSTKIPRINNIPEIVVIDLLPVERT